MYATENVEDLFSSQHVRSAQPVDGCALLHSPLASAAVAHFDERVFAIVLGEYLQSAKNICAMKLRHLRGWNLGEEANRASGSGWPITTRAQLQLREVNVHFLTSWNHCLQESRVRVYRLTKAYRAVWHLS